MAIRPIHLLRSWGFSHDPFAVSSAENEKQELTSGIRKAAFLEPPYYLEIASVENLTSTVVFGYRGEGKSTLGNMFELTFSGDIVSTTILPRVLLVRYDHHHSWSAEDISSMDLETHLNRILPLLVDAFIEAAHDHTTLLDNVSRDVISLGRLEWFIMKYAPAIHFDEAQRIMNLLLERLQYRNRAIQYYHKSTRRTASLLRSRLMAMDRAGKEKSPIAQGIRAVLAFIAPSVPDEKGLRNAKTYDLLERLRDIILLSGYKGICILVDKIDEADPFSGHPTLVKKFISPLISNLAYMETPRVATKVFLPMNTRELLVDLRPDRIRIVDIVWSKPLLRRMLERRLLAFSKGEHSSLKPFVEKLAWPEFDRLVFYHAALSPRDLIRVLREIVSHHCQQIDSPCQLTRQVLHDGIAYFLHQRRSEEDAEEYNRRLREDPDQPDIDSPRRAS